MSSGREGVQAGATTILTLTRMPVTCSRNKPAPDKLSGEAASGRGVPRVPQCSTPEMPGNYSKCLEIKSLPPDCGCVSSQPLLSRGRSIDGGLRSTVTICTVVLPVPVANSHLDREAHLQKPSLTQKRCQYKVPMLLQVLLLCACCVSALREEVVVFQAVDDSFLSLWINWWAIALKSEAIPSHWGIHIACFGDDTPAIVEKFYKHGCAQKVSGKMYVRQIYLAKWLAITNAFKLGKSMLVIDIDALLIKNPTKMLRLDEAGADRFDVIISRDHGPPEVPYSQLWGNARFCTGFVYFQHSQKTQELVEWSLNRCRKYGHDQIQFNNALSRSGLVFAEPADALNDDSRSHDAFLPWYHQTDPDFLAMCSPSEYDTRHSDATALLRREKQPCNTTWPEVAVASAGAPERISVRLLGRYTALRYCIKPQQGDSWLYNVKVVSLTPEQREGVSSLHCFTEQGPLGEQGRRKRQQKFNVMLGINTWVLRDKYSHEGDFDLFMREGDTLLEPADFGNPDSASAKAFVAKYVDPHYYELFQRVWLEGDASAHVNLFANKTRSARRPERGPLAARRGKSKLVNNPVNKLPAE